MTRQDFQVIADTLRGLQEGGGLCFGDDEDYAAIVQAFANALALANNPNNPSFPWKQFREEAGVFYYTEEARDEELHNDRTQDESYTPCPRCDGARGWYVPRFGNMTQGELWETTWVPCDHCAPEELE